MSLVLLVGGSFAVAGMINNGKDLNAQNDLDKIATAEAAVQANGGKYLSYFAAADGTVNPDWSSKNPDGQTLNKSAVGVTLSTAVDVVNDTNAGSGYDGSTWFAVSKSATGKFFVRTANSTKTVPISAADLENKYTLADVTGSGSDIAIY